MRCPSNAEKLEAFVCFVAGGGVVLHRGLALYRVLIGTEERGKRPKRGGGDWDKISG